MVAPRSYAQLAQALAYGPPQNYGAGMAFAELNIFAELQTLEDWVIEQLLEIVETAREERDCRLGTAAIRTLAKIAGFI